MGEEHPTFHYFSPAGTHVFAHRGFASDNAPENTLAAFEAAITAGATHIETDAQATLDGVAVLFHDDGLARVAGLDLRIDSVSFEYLATIDLAGQRIPSLAEALVRFPEARFNIDIKRSNAIAPTVEAIRANKADNRVLVSSFSGTRRRKALKMLAAQGLRVATSADAGLMLGLYLASRLGLYGLFSGLAKSIQALQVPDRILGLDLTHPRFLRYCKSAELQLDYWVVNDSATMLRLVALGADGIVTDRPDIAVATLRV